MLKRPNRYVRIICVLGTFIIFFSFIIPDHFGGCQMRGVTTCENAFIERIARFGNVIGYSVLLVFPVFIYLYMILVTLGEFFHGMVYLWKVTKKR